MPTTQDQIQEIQRRLAQLKDEAADQLREKLKEARKVVLDLEHQLSTLTGRPTATQIKVVKGFAPITDEDIEVQILFVLQQNPDGLNAVGIAGRLNQGPQRIRSWIKSNPGKLRREGEGMGTRYFVG